MITGTVRIMGEIWTICECTAEEEERLAEADGFCDWTTRTIAIERETNGNLEDMEAYIKKVKRHEIVHAFLCSCGLNESSAAVDAWAMNEEMVDWFARMGQQIYKAWQEANAI